MTTVQRQTGPHPELRSWVAPVDRLLAGYDADAYTLPEELMTARGALRRVQASITNLKAPPDPGLVVGELAAVVTTGSGPIKTADIGKRLVDAEAAVEQHAASLHVLRQAEASTASALRNIMETLAEEIVTEHLRPALEETLASVRELAPALGGATSPDELLRSDEAAREAWFGLDALAGRWRQIRTAYTDSIYRSVFGPEVGVSDLDLRTQLAYRNAYALPKADNRTDIAAPSRPPLYMVWLIDGAGGVVPEPWLPLPADVEQALREARERVKAEQAAGVAAARSRSAAAERKDTGEREQREAKAEPGPWGSNR